MGNLKVQEIGDIQPCFVKKPRLEEFTVYTVGVCTVEMIGPDGPVDVQMEDAGDGTVRVKYEALNLVPGEYSIDVMDDSQSIAKYHVVSTPDTEELTVKKTVDIEQCSVPVEEFGLEEFIVFTRGHDGQSAVGVCTVEMV